MALVALLLDDRLCVARASAAMGDAYPSITCTSWGHLLRVVARDAVSVIIVDPKFPDDGDVLDALRQLRRQYSAVAIVGYVSIPPCTEIDLFEYGRLGLDALALKDSTDSIRALRATIERAEARGLLDPIRRALGPVNPTVRDAVLMSISRAQSRLSPDSMARALGISRAHLTSQLTSCGFPSPPQLIAWGRLIVASRMLEDERRSANAVAAALEYPSASAFRNMCQRYLATSPAEIRSRGGAAFAATMLFTSTALLPPTFTQLSAGQGMRNGVPMEQTP
jgi:AraC-like DNA-binding protein